MHEIRFLVDRTGQRVRNYFLALARFGDSATPEAFEHALVLLQLHGAALTMPHARLIDRRDRIHELRVRDHRVAFIADGKTVILLHAWRKRSQRLDRREAATAARLAAIWRTSEEAR